MLNRNWGGVLNLIAFGCQDKLEEVVEKLAISQQEVGDSSSDQSCHVVNIETIMNSCQCCQNFRALNCGIFFCFARSKQLQSSPILGHPLNSFLNPRQAISE